MEPLKNVFLCPFCGHLSQMTWVHGHGQCTICGMTVDECCRGEQACDLDDPELVKKIERSTPPKKIDTNNEKKPD